MTEIFSWLMDLLFITIFSLIGAIAKDTYNTLTDKEAKVNIVRILLSTIVSTVILFSLSDFILSKISLKSFILPCFIGGIIGFEIMGKINKLEFWLKLYRKKGDVIQTFKDDGLLKNELSKDTKENNKEGS